MRARRRSAAGVTVRLILVAAMVIAGLMPRPASAQGERLSPVKALIEGLESEDVSVRRACARKLGDYGPDSAEAVPALIKALDDEDRRVVLKAIWALGRIGPKAEDAVRPLAKKLDSSKTREAAGNALAGIGPAALPALKKKLGPKNRKGARFFAILTLAKFGKHGVPLLMRSLRDDTPEIRQCAADALGKIGPDAGEAVPKLKLLLRQEKITESRRRIALALGKMGEAAEPAIDALRDTLAEGSKPVKLACAESLGRLGAIAAPARKRLREAAESSDKEVKEAAESALAKIEAALKKAER